MGTDGTDTGVCRRNGRLGGLATAIVLLCIHALVSPTTASAATCTSAERALLRQASAHITSLAKTAPGRTDAQAVLTRARSQCRTANFALAVATLTQRYGGATEERTYTLNRMIFRGSLGTYRFDPLANASAWRAIQTPRSAASRLLQLQRYSVVGPAGTYWTPDPTRRVVNPGLQIDMAATFAQSRTTPAKRLAATTLRVVSGREQSLVRSRMFDFLARTQRVVRVAKKTGATSNRTLSTRLLATTATRVRGADTGTWSQIDGHSSSLAEHRMLVQHMAAIGRDSGNATIKAQAARLDGYLRSAPDVRFSQVPVGTFYPFPVDGVKDTQAVSLTMNKPGSITVTVYDAAGAAIDTMSGIVQYGVWNAAWNGKNSSGGAVAAGSYRYSITASDLADNRRLLPGVGSFTVGRDTQAPTITSSRVSYLGGTTRRRINVRWDVVENISPRLRAQLIVNGPGGRRVLPVVGTSRTGSVTMNVRNLARGTYRTQLQVFDGAGNVTTKQTTNLRF